MQKYYISQRTIYPKYHSFQRSIRSERNIHPKDSSMLTKYSSLIYFKGAFILIEAFPKNYPFQLIIRPQRIIHPKNHLSKRIIHHKNHSLKRIIHPKESFVSKKHSS